MGQADNHRHTDDHPDEEIPRDFDSHSLAEFLKIDVVYEPDDDAPPVERDALVALVRGTLNDAEATRITRLVATYRPWNDAFRDILRREIGAE